LDKKGCGSEPGLGLVNPPRSDWNLPHPIYLKGNAVNNVSSFRPCHESNGVGISGLPGRTADLLISSEHGTARKFLWSRPMGGIGFEASASKQNQMDD